MAPKYPGRRHVGSVAAAIRPRQQGGADIGVERRFALEETDGTLTHLSGGGFALEEDRLRAWNTSLQRAHNKTVPVSRQVPHSLLVAQSVGI
jgi:hypothetical protein